uniref:Uncharacterized protein n=1 Tax=Nothobranchius furzeri TaxID=105023 RepID=A0A1A8UEA6_NOTFU
MWEPDTEQREKEQSLKLTGCCTRKERRLLQCDSNKENDQYATSIQGELEVFPNGCSISLRGETKSVLQRCVYMSDRAARRCESKFPDSASAGDAEAADRRAARTRLNLYFFLPFSFPPTS